jgi:hypothetical protein
VSQPRPSLLPSRLSSSVIGTTAAVVLAFATGMKAGIETIRWSIFIQTYQPFDLLEVAIGFRRCGFWPIHAASRIRNAVKHALQDSPS